MTPHLTGNSTWHDTQNLRSANAEQSWDVLFAAVAEVYPARDGKMHHLALGVATKVTTHPQVLFSGRWYRLQHCRAAEDGAMALQPRLPPPPAQGGHGH